MGRYNTITANGGEMKEKMIEGVNELYDTVCATMGPGGQLVVIERPNGEPDLTKDGITAAESVHPVDSVANLGVQILRQSSMKTFNKVGDGTTTSICLGKHMVDRLNGLKITRDLEFEVDKELEMFKSFLKQYTIPFNPRKHLEHVLRTASNGDEGIVANLTEIYNFQGFDNTIYMAGSDKSETTVLKENFYLINNGMFSNDFANEGHAFVGEDVIVFVLDYKIPSLQEFDPLLIAELQKLQKPVLFLCHGIDPQALAMLAQLNACVVVPDRSFAKSDAFKDLCALTGATFISEETGFKRSDLSSDHAGYLSKVHATRKFAKLYQDKPMSGYDKYVEGIKGMINDAENDKEVELVTERVNKLNMKVSNVLIGGNSEAEKAEVKARYDDAIRAVKSSYKYGVVRGSAYTLSLFESNYLMTHCCKDKVYENAGIKDESVKPGEFYDFEVNDFVPYNDLKVFDPAMALLESVKNASSVALAISKTHVAVYYENINEVF